MLICGAHGRSLPRSFRFGLGVLLVAAVTLGACGGDEARTELVVVIDTDFDVPGELDEVALTVEGPSGMQYPVAADLGAEGAPTLPLYTFLEPAGADLGPVTITATGLFAEAVLVERVVRTSFVQDQSLTVYITLGRSCAAVNCRGETTCDDGTCRSWDVPASSLPPWSGSLEEPDAAVDASEDARLDAGPDGAADGGDSCVPATETCNSADDDCDGLTDEGFDLTTDSANCGACGTVCEDQPRSSVSCTAGSCVLACDSGFDDCDTDYATGCEADLSAPATCRACGTSCGAGAPLCDPSSGCVSGCSGGAELCGMACVATATDTSNCGTCGNVCPDQPRSSPTCNSGSCGYACDAGFGDCDGSPGNGCEERLNSVAHCNACGVRCAVANGAGDCSTGACRIGTCTSGFADCDTNPANGCETAERVIYRDVDGDRYGDPLVSMTAGCVVPAGWVTDNTDCDDTLTAVNPGAPEVCNGRDDDCSATTDEASLRCAETCATAMVVEGSATFTDRETCTADDNAAPVCDADGGGDHVYRLELAAPTTVEYTIGGDIHRALWISNTCGATTPLYCTDHANNESLMLGAGTYYLHVEATHVACDRRYTLQITYR